MHIILRNTTGGSDKTYTITTSKWQIECHNGKTGGAQALSRVIDCQPREVDGHVERLLREKRRGGYSEVSKSQLELDWLEPGQVTAVIRPECVDRLRAVDARRCGQPLAIGDYLIRCAPEAKAVEVRWRFGKDERGSSLWGCLGAGAILTGPVGSPAAKLALALWKQGLAGLMSYPDHPPQARWKSASPTAKIQDNGVDALFLPTPIQEGLAALSADVEFGAFVEALSSHPAEPCLSDLLGAGGIWKDVASPLVLL